MQEGTPSKPIREMDSPSSFPQKNNRAMRSSKTGDAADNRPPFLAFSPLQNSSALQQSDDQNDHGDDQKKVNEAAGVERKKPQRPQDEQDDQDCPKHENLLLSFYPLPSCALPLPDRAMDSKRATRTHAIFMPNSFGALSRLKSPFSGQSQAGRTNWSAFILCNCPIKQHISY
jgi:hypothetical protein